MCRSQLRTGLRVLVCVGLLPLAGSVGCSVLYQLAYGDGQKVKAEYQGLSGKRVAVVCMMNASSFSDGVTSTDIAESVGAILAKEVDEIDVVPQEDVADWMDENEWDEADFTEIGRGVEADTVVAIEVDAFSLHESTTLLKGRADVTTTVYDMTKDGKKAFRTTDRDFSFPTNHPVPATPNSQRTFRYVFIRELAEQIAKNFYDYNLSEDFARDGASYAH
jgi:hypothetical protein